MEIFAEEYFRICEHLLGKSETEILKVESTRPGMPPVGVIMYADWPTPGVLTGVTMGVSRGLHHPEFDGHPELMLSLRSDNPGWHFAAGVLAEQARDQVNLEPGSVLNMREPIVQGSAATGFILRHPRHWGGGLMMREVAGERIFLLEAQPLQPSEIDAAKNGDDQFREALLSRLSSADFDPDRAPTTLQ